MANKITVSGIPSLKSTNYRRIQVNKVEKVCATCGRSLGALKPYGQIFIPRALGDLDEITIKVRAGEEKTEK